MTTTGVLELRDYQAKAVDTVFDEFYQGVMRQLVVMATGLGKTATAVNIARRWSDTMPRDRVLWLTHRDELVDQTIRAIETWWPELTQLMSSRAIGVVKAERNDMDQLFTIASVQTLAVPARRNALITNNQYGLVISDEHHLSPAPSWAGVLDALGCGTPDGPLMVGLTATPDRADGIGLKVTTDKITVEHDIVWAIANGYLVSPKGIAVDVDLSQVKVSGGDYQIGSLGDVLEMGGSHIAVARLLREHAPDRKSIVFTPTVQFAHLVAQQCRNIGISAEVVSGETPSHERHRIYANLRSGAVRVIVNCAVLIEGFDEPSVDCIVMARPTKSRTLFTQACGRGLRLFPGKDDCLIIALAGTERHKLATVASLAGRKWEDKLKAAEAAKGDAEFDFAAELDELTRREAEQAGLKGREINLLAAVRKRVAWAVINDGVFCKRISDEDGNRDRDRVIIVKHQRRDDTWEVIEARPIPNTWNHRYKPLLTGVDLDTARGHADDIIRRELPAALRDANAPWRKQRASDKQMAQLTKAKVRFNPNEITKGQASDLLDVKYLSTVASRA